VFKPLFIPYRAIHLSDCFLIHFLHSYNLSDQKSYKELKESLSGNDLEIYLRTGRVARKAPRTDCSQGAPLDTIVQKASAVNFLAGTARPVPALQCCAAGFPVAGILSRLLPL
jgi:hypothetical protein